MPVPEANSVAAHSVATISIARPASVPSSFPAAIRSTSAGGRGTTPIVVHSRSSSIRFRILSLSAPAPSLTELPVSATPRHRMCQKAKDCNGDETSDRIQR